MKQVITVLSVEISCDQETGHLTQWVGKDRAEARRRSMRNLLPDRWYTSCNKFPSTNIRYFIEGQSTK